MEERFGEVAQRRIIYAGFVFYMERDMLLLMYRRIRLDIPGNLSAEVCLGVSVERLCYSRGDAMVSGLSNSTREELRECSGGRC